MTRRGRGGTAVVVLGLFGLYFLGNATAPPNADDGGIALGYIDRLSRGERLHFDFLDYYGPLTYLLPSVAYQLAGKKVIGVRLWMVVVKLATLAAAYFSVSRLADRLYALLAVLVLGVLLGLPWAMFQIPYAHHLTLPLGLVAAGLLLESGRPPSMPRLVVCGLLTAAMALMKVSIGVFFMLGALLYLFYLVRPPPEASRSEGEKLAVPVRVAQGVGLVVYPLVLHRFIAEHYDGMYFVYLTLPTLVVMVVCGSEMIGGIRARLPVTHHLTGWSIYLAVTTLAFVATLTAFLGPSELLPYFREQYRVLHFMQLVGHFEPIGVRGLFRGFGEYFWPQLPWFATAVYLVAALCERARRGRKRLGGELVTASARVSGAFAIVTLHGYVIYSVPDDAHVMQHLLLVAPLIFVLLRHLGWVVFRDSRPLRGWSMAVAAGAVLHASTMVFLPPREAYAFGAGDWHNPRLAHLRYHPSWSSWSNPVNPEVSDRVLDAQLDDAATQIDALTDDGETILVLAPMHLVYYASNTVPALSRYAHLFYLLGHGRLTAAQFRELVPERERSALLARPPRVVVRIHEKQQILAALPELQQALSSAGYRMVGRWGVLTVYLREDRLSRGPRPRD